MYFLKPSNPELTCDCSQPGLRKEGPPRPTLTETQVFPEAAGHHACFFISQALTMPQATLVYIQAFKKCGRHLEVSLGSGGKGLQTHSTTSSFVSLQGVWNVQGRFFFCLALSINIRCSSLSLA